MNQFKLDGRLVRDPEFQSFGDDGGVLARITIASDRARSDSTDFFNVTVFGDVAERLRGATPGTPISVGGVVRQDSWIGDDQEKHHTIQFVGREVITLPRSGRADGGPAASVDAARAPTVQR